LTSIFAENEQSEKIPPSYNAHFDASTLTATGPLVATASKSDA